MKCAMLQAGEMRRSLEELSDAINRGMSAAAAAMVEGLLPRRYRVDPRVFDFGLVGVSRRQCDVLVRQRWRAVAHQTRDDDARLRFLI